MGNPNLYLDQPITKAWFQPIGGHVSNPNDNPIATVTRLEVSSSLTCEEIPNIYLNQSTTQPETQPIGGQDCESVYLFSVHGLIWVRSGNCGCLFTWFCYQLIAKPGNKTATVSWPDPYINTPYNPTFKSLLLSWRSGVSRFHLPAPDLQMSPIKWYSTPHPPQ